MDFLKTVKSISGKKGLLRVVLVWIFGWKIAVEGLISFWRFERRFRATNEGLCNFKIYSKGK